jgi:hypothetical protein
MHGKAQRPIAIFRMSRSPASVRLTMLFPILLFLFLTLTTQAHANCLRRNRFSAIRDERDRTEERRNVPHSKRIPKPARISDDNCRWLDIASAL